MIPSMKHLWHVAEHESFALQHVMQVRVKAVYRFPVTLPDKEVKDILIPQKDDRGRELVAYQTILSGNMCSKLWDAFVAKMDKANAAAIACAQSAAAAGAKEGQ